MTGASPASPPECALRTASDRYSTAVRRVIYAVAGVAELSFLAVSWTPFTRLADAVGQSATLAAFAPLVVALPTAGILATAALLGDLPWREKEPASAFPRRLDRVGLLLVRAACLWYFAVLAIAAAGAVDPSRTLMQVVDDQVPLMGQYFPLALLLPGLLPRRASYASTTLPVVVFLAGTALSGSRDPVIWDHGPYYLLFNVMYMAWTDWVLRQAQALDRDRSERRRREREVARLRAVTGARQQRDAFVHDHVLSALVPAATRIADGPTLAEAARVALDALDDVMATPIPSTPAQVFASIRVYAAGTGLDVVADSQVHSDTPLPADVGNAMIGAAEEALRNGVRHARGLDGRPLTIRLTMSADEAGVRVSVADNGPGFDPTLIPDGHFGIRRSIIARIEQIGGVAKVRSAPGEGTVIDLSWKPEETPSSPGGRRPILAFHTALPTDSRYSAQAPVARLIGVYAILLQVLIAWHVAEDYTDIRVVIVALALQAMAGALCLFPWTAAQMPRWAVATAAAVAAATPIMVFTQLPSGDWPAWAPWVGATGSVLLCGVLTLRQRMTAAWAAWALRLAGTAVWAHLTGIPVAPTVLSLSASHTFSLFLWGIATVWSARVSRLIADEQRRALELDATRDTQQEIREIMDRSLVHIDERARPVLCAIAAESGRGRLTETTHLRARLLESELRDEIRAPLFTGTAVAVEAAAARRRGVDVVLLDDSGASGLSSPARDRIVDRAAEQLKAATEGRVIVRVFPPGRPLLATIVANGDRMSIEADAPPPPAGQAGLAGDRTNRPASPPAPGNPRGARIDPAAQRG
ncbi:sensor histidine kinase [Schaalia naturae]|uniref:Sensor histidine kinase n=1 Tax=Schaalia naturae TaxID=635203 RepID=A0ABW2SP82_9ACTO